MARQRRLRGLTGRYRSVFRAALQASSYDFYLYTEDDHGLTSAHIEALCCETRYLETHWRGAARLFATAKRFVRLVRQTASPWRPRAAT